MTKTIHVKHVIGCSCDECTFPEDKCPNCKSHLAVGQYSCVAPYEWFWMYGEGDGYEYSEIKFCPNCGEKLPSRGQNPCADCKTHRQRIVISTREQDDTRHKWSASG